MLELMFVAAAKAIQLGLISTSAAIDTKPQIRCMCSFASLNLVSAALAPTDSEMGGKEACMEKL